MPNVNDHHKGLRVVTTGAVTGNRFSATFPGWGDPNYADHLIPMEAGLAGTIINVESHGSNPWTRYGIAFDDGTRAHGVHPNAVTIFVKR